MIVELAVENLAIIERSRLTLHSGFTVLTGETGAGKSLLIDAIELALGERADTELVRAGARSAKVNVVLDLSASPHAIERCTELGVMTEDGRLYVDREVLAEGRSQCRINGKLSPVSQLRQLGQLLVDLHGQHDHQSLLDSERHIEYLDLWIGEPASALLAELSEAFGRAEQLKRRLASIRTGMRDREQRLDLLKFQVQEIESANPVEGEMEQLESQLSRLRNVERLSASVTGSLQLLGDSEPNALDQLSAAAKLLEDAGRLDPGLDEVSKPVREALYLLQEGVHEVRAYFESLEANPTLLEEVAARIDTLRLLRRKYGDDEAQILLYLDTIRREMEELQGSELSEEELSKAHDAAYQEMLEVSGRLSDLRKQRAVEFGALVQEQLRELAMDKALFAVDFQPKEPTASGSDQVEFFFTANAGEPPRPLSKIASGGEISRVMLAIKTGLAGKAGVPTLIFDEVDAGLGGRAAATVARKLEQLAEHYQVLVISHLPQIAGRASTHFRIEKSEIGGRVTTDVRELSPDERVEEIARMLAGEQVTDSALANARELLSA